MKAWAGTIDKARYLYNVERDGSVFPLRTTGEFNPRLDIGFPSSLLQVLFRLPVKGALEVLKSIKQGVAVERVLDLLLPLLLKHLLPVLSSDELEQGLVKQIGVNMERRLVASEKEYSLTMLGQEVCVRLHRLGPAAEVDTIIQQRIHVLTAAGNLVLYYCAQRSYERACWMDDCFKALNPSIMTMSNSYTWGLREAFEQPIGLADYAAGAAATSAIDEAVQAWPIEFDNQPRRAICCEWIVNTLLDIVSRLEIEPDT